MPGWILHLADQFKTFATMSLDRPGGLSRQARSAGWPPHSTLLSGLAGEQGRVIPLTFLNMNFNVIQLSKGSSRLLSERNFWSLAPRSLRVGRFSWPDFYFCSVTPIDSCKTTGSIRNENLAPNYQYLLCVDIRHAKPDEISGCTVGEFPCEANSETGLGEMEKHLRQVPALSPCRICCVFAP